ncbi:hypothetical protein F444_15349 [Phytophthora nicotianae P1976]|uniref:Uncharacterized protein n=1 Tax=Phytophthora nicotianae P1976 TaxID=1317066 RepID=A0A080ZM97_PHYNI|nr:hypothetical protein F444_15349 [Phytophthora nicotianae P1976]
MARQYEMQVLSSYSKRLHRRRLNLDALEEALHGRAETLPTVDDVHLLGWTMLENW